MKRNSFWRTVAFILGGAVLGTLAGQLLASQVPFLKQQTSIRWNPSADIAVIRYAIDMTIRVNWITLVGVIVAFFADRKMK